MLNKAKTLSSIQPGAGLVTYSNIFALQPGQTPNAMNVKFGVGGTVEKRLGSTTMNATILVSSAATGFTVDSGKTLATSLKSYYKLDEQSGTRVDTFSTNNLNDVNSTSFAAGLVGNAASFVQANSNYLEFPYSAGNPAFNVGSTSFSASCYVYLNTNNNQVIIAKWATGNNSREYSLNFDAATQNFFFFATSDGVTGLQVQASSFGAISTATWYGLVCFHDSANQRIGISVNLSLNTLNLVGGIYSGNANFRVGADQSTPIFAQARVDELGWWSKVLSAQERSDLWNTGTGNSYGKGASNSGFGSFDFGAGFGADNLPLRHLVVSAGTGIFASSNRGVSFVAIATDRGADYQEFERSKSNLFAFSNTYNRVLYWAGSVGTSMLGMAVGSAPPVKHGIDFAGFLMFMNDSGGKRIVTYAPNNTALTDPWNTTFEIPSSFDDEITGTAILDRSCYTFTKYTVARISAVGGNPDFGVQKLKSWGAVPRTIKRVTLPLLPWVGEVIICLGWDKKIRIFDGYYERVISDVIEQDNGMFPAPLSKIEDNSIQKSHAEVDTFDQTYRLWVAISPSTEVTHMIGLNLRTFAFYAYDNQTFSTVVQADSGNFRNLFGVTRGGFVHKMDTGNTDAGTAINDYYDSPFLMGQVPKSVIKNQKVDLWFSATSSGTMYYQERKNFSSTFETPPRASMAFTDTTTIVQQRWSIDIPTNQNVYQFRVTSSSSTANPWKLNRHDLHLYDLGVGEA